jgi:phage terminase large subunit-like protein
MKKVKKSLSYTLYAVLGCVLLLNVSCGDSFVEVVRKYKLEITSSNGDVYYTSEFNKKLDCIEFKGVKIEHTYKKHGAFKVCGSFTVEDNIYYNCEGIDCF